MVLAKDPTVAKLLYRNVSIRDNQVAWAKGSNDLAQYLGATRPEVVWN